jgi:hypothetical protein
MPHVPGLLPRRVVHRYGARLLIELLVVFIGVFLGILASNLAQQREQERRNVQVYRALAREISVFVNATPGVVAYADSLIADWERRYAAGERPAPVDFRLQGIDAPPRGMWDAVMATGAIATADVHLVAEVSEYYNTVENALRKYESVKTFGEREIVPRSADPEGFYAPDGSLRPEYRQHMRNLVDMRETLASTHHGGAAMRRQLAQRLPRAPERALPREVRLAVEGLYRFDEEQPAGIGEPDTARIYSQGDSLMYRGATSQRLLHQGAGVFLLAEEPDVRVVFPVGVDRVDALLKEGGVSPGRTGRASRVP